MNWLLKSKAARVLTGAGAMAGMLFLLADETWPLRHPLTTAITMAALLLSAVNLGYQLKRWLG